MDEPITETFSPPDKLLVRFKKGLLKTSRLLSEGISTVISKRKIDRSVLQDLEDLLLQADLGLEATSQIIDTISKNSYDKNITENEIHKILALEIERLLTPVERTLHIMPTNKPHVILVVGVNGGGKTTTIGKLAAQFSCQGKSVMLAAGDTFRAAAIEQLKVWGSRTSSEVISSPLGSDSASLAYEALKQAQQKGVDILFIDTAGRLQNKQALMEELEKVVRVLKKIDVSAPHEVLLVLDATTGQNALQQVEIFRKHAAVSGLIITKLDGTARGGILVAIAAKYQIPVYAIGIGENVEDLQPFSAKDYAEAIIRH
ncbi:MAG: signal recognition particle-docking protein FtsY [Hyphomicrobium sp.]